MAVPVAGKRAGSTSVGSPAARRRKNPRKARPGNRNAVKHGVYAALAAAKKAARTARDRFRRRGEREARAILKAARLSGDPLAKMVARQVGRLESVAHRFEHYHETRGYFLKSGEPRPSVAQQVSVIERLLAEARKLFEVLQQRGHGSEMANAKPDLYQVEFADGTILYPAGVLGMGGESQESGIEVPDDIDAADESQDDTDAPELAEENVGARDGAGRGRTRNRSVTGEEPARAASAPATPAPRKSNRPVTLTSDLGLDRKVSRAEVHGWTNFGGDVDG